MDCLVECEQLGSAGSLWCNMFSGGQQTQARERVLKRTLHSNTRDTLEGGERVFLFGFGAQEYTLGDETEAVWPRGGFIAPSPFAKGPWFEGISRTAPCVAGALAAWSSFEAIYTPHLTLEVANRCERAACSTRGALVSTWSPMRAAGG